MLEITSPLFIPIAFKASALNDVPAPGGPSVGLRCVSNCLVFTVPIPTRPSAYLVASAYHSGFSSAIALTRTPPPIACCILTVILNSVADYAAYARWVWDTNAYGLFTAPVAVMVQIDAMAEMALNVFTLYRSTIGPFVDYGRTMAEYYNSFGPLRSPTEIKSGETVPNTSRTSTPQSVDPYLSTIDSSKGPIKYALWATPAWGNPRIAREVVVDGKPTGTDGHPTLVGSKFGLWFGKLSGFGPLGRGGGEIKTLPGGGLILTDAS